MREQKAARLLGWLLAGFAAAAVALGICAGLLPLAAILLGMAGLAGATPLALARARVAAHEANPALIGRAARRPQASLVPLLALGAAGIAWLATRDATAPRGPWALAICAVSAFALLVAERSIAAAPALPEAAALSRLLRVPVAIVAIQGLLLAAREAGLPGTSTAATLAAIAVGAIGLELAARGLARAFLPPPAPDSARAAIDSILLRAAIRPTPSGLAAPLRDHFGLDFSRSWALSFGQAALLPLGFFLLLAGWGLTGVIIVPADGRAVAERFGAPVAVLPPGLHVVLPWPLGRAVPVEFGTVHEITLAGDALPIEPASAEAAAPPSADRLWGAAHPGELTFLVASQTGNRQGFQIVSADLRVLWRVGLTDADAVHRVVATQDPDAVTRHATARAVAAALAGRTLDATLGAGRDALADQVRDAAQHVLNGYGSGLEIVAVVIEAIHPPPGAADAYHHVQAAEIAATTSISTEAGRARATMAMAQQRAAARLDEAQASAAEQQQDALSAQTRFTADRDAARAGGPAFLLERTQNALVAALSGAPKTILDPRLGADAPAVIDLRPFLPAAPAARDD